jgi:2,5-furandicarboxylate decarboxylase 1
MVDLRSFIAWATRKRQLREVTQPVDPDCEMAALMHAADGRPLLFDSLKRHSGWRAVTGLCAQRRYFAAALGCAEPELVSRMTEAAANPSPPPIVDSGPCQQVTRRKVDLTKLPIPRYHPQDGGCYITSGVLAVRDPDYGRNIAFHRLMVLDERRFAARVVEGRGTHTAWQKARADLPVAIAVGCPMQVLLAAAMSPPKGVDELAIAHALVDTPLVRCRSVDLEVPAEAELILEGRMTHALADEGPFPDLTGTMDSVRRQPVIEIDRVTHRREPIFHALLPGGLEHKNLMGMPREPTIYAAVSEVCRCTGVYVTPGGASWLHAVVQIEKATQEDGRRAIWAAFHGHTSLKHVVVVDTDVDLTNAADVEWAIATRFQADRDLVTLADQPGSSLDPSASQAPGTKARTAKMGLDATAPLGEARRGFERVTYKQTDRGKHGLKPR